MGAGHTLRADHPVEMRLTPIDVILRVDVVEVGQELGVCRDRVIRLEERGQAKLPVARKALDNVERLGARLAFPSSPVLCDVAQVAVQRFCVIVHVDEDPSGPRPDSRLWEARLRPIKMFEVPWARDARQLPRQGPGEAMKWAPEVT